MTDNNRYIMDLIPSTFIFMLLTSLQDLGLHLARPTLPQPGPANKNCAIDEWQ